MKFIRNPEIQKDILFSIFFLMAICIVTFFVVGTVTSAVVFLTGIVFGILHYFSTWRRYRKIAIMSQNLDEILHDDSVALLQECEEGELAILYSQLVKLVRRFRQQNSDLRKDRILLADSLADISHQIKTPLTSSHLLLRFLEEENITLERRCEIAREIMVLLERINWLVYALLKMSRLDAGVAVMKTEKVSVQELARKAYELVAVTMDIRNIQWSAQIAPEASFSGNLSWSVEAVSNIIKNALEHVPDGGSISLIGEENAIYTEIRIEDSGTGIAPEDLPHLFERFYRGKGNDSQSIGIGLSLAQKIVIGQNGTIDVKNREQGGAVFRIRFYKMVV